MTVPYVRVLTFPRRSAFRKHILLLGAALAMAGCSLNRQDALKWAEQPDEPGALSVMSFNVLVGGQPADVVLDTIADASPDLVCLQEVTSEFAGRFERRFGADYLHRAFAPGPAVHGIGIASRLPLTDPRLLTLGRPYLPAVAATMQSETEPVRVACVHFVPPLARFEPLESVSEQYYRNRTTRTGRARLLLQHIDSTAIPAIVLGDMNERDGQAALTVLAEAGFRSACLGRDSRCAATWPGDVAYGPAVIRIDHILGRGVEFRQAAVLNAGGSDHYPVVARFAVADTRP